MRLGTGQAGREIKTGTGREVANIHFFFIIVLSYVFCHGLTALLVTPIQQEFLAEITIFASLVYLPHGVRVLATWLWGWKAFFPLAVGGGISELIFTPTQVHDLMRDSLPLSVGVGAASALLAFEATRLLGRNLYASKSNRINWKGLLIIGAVASIINSVLQSFVYSGIILPERAAVVLMTYAVGDLIGLFVSTVALMMIFRWVRLSGIFS